MLGRPQSSLHPAHAPDRAHPGLHTLPPLTPVRDRADARFRAKNFRASMNACPACWRHYYEAMAKAIEREVN